MLFDNLIDNAGRSRGYESYNNKIMKVIAIIKKANLVPCMAMASIEFNMQFNSESNRWSRMHEVETLELDFKAYSSCVNFDYKIHREIF